MEHTIWAMHCGCRRDKNKNATGESTIKFFLNQETKKNCVNVKKFNAINNSNHNLKLVCRKTKLRNFHDFSKCRFVTPRA